MKKIIFLMLSSVIGSVSIRAQSIGPATFNATGGSNIVSGNEFEWSVGEMTLVNTFSSSSIVVTQGVLQPSDIATRVVDNTMLQQQLKVFPNPATSIVNLQYTSATHGTMSYRLLDIAGKVVNTTTIDIAPGANNGQIDVSTLACATYMLDVSLDSGENKKEHAIFKIQKLK
jgi:hypothetical protein